MRLIEKVPGAKHGWAYVMKLGYSEVEMLHDLVREAHRNTPKVFELNPARNRMQSMLGVLGPIVSARRGNNPGYHPEDYVHDVLHAPEEKKV